MNSGLRILLVDDEPMIIASVGRFLRLQHYETVTCMDGQEALQRAQAERFDVVIADFDLPSLQGLSLLCQLRPHMPDALLVLASGSSSMEPPVRAAGEDIVFLAKPFDLESLLAIIRIAMKC